MNVQDYLYHTEKQFVLLESLLGSERNARYHAHLCVADQLCPLDPNFMSLLLEQIHKIELTEHTIKLYRHCWHTSAMTLQASEACFQIFQSTSDASIKICCLRVLTILACRRPFLSTAVLSLLQVSLSENDLEFRIHVLLNLRLISSHITSINRFSVAVFWDCCKLFCNSDHARVQTVLLSSLHRWASRADFLTNCLESNTDVSLDLLIESLLAYSLHGHPHAHFATLVILYLKSHPLLLYYFSVEWKHSLIQHLSDVLDRILESSTNLMLAAHKNHQIRVWMHSFFMLLSSILNQSADCSTIIPKIITCIENEKSSKVILQALLMTDAGISSFRILAFDLLKNLKRPYLMPVIRGIFVHHLPFDIKLSDFIIDQLDANHENAKLHGIDYYYLAMRAVSSGWWDVASYLFAYLGQLLSTLETTNALNRLKEALGKWDAYAEQEALIPSLLGQEYTESDWNNGIQEFLSNFEPVDLPSLTEYQLKWTHLRRDCLNFCKVHFDQSAERTKNTLRRKELVSMMEMKAKELMESDVQQRDHHEEKTLEKWLHRIQAWNNCSTNEELQLALKAYLLDSYVIPIPFKNSS